MADDVTLGTRIRQLRKANGWTLADVAARTGLSVSFLSDIERGRTDPSLNTLDKIAAAHGLRVAITITKDGDTPMADDVTLLPLGGEGEALQASFEAYRNAVNACIADLKAQLAEAREWSSTLADAADDLRAELREAQEALATSGIGGIYDTFQDVGDAIRQIAAYIKERDARIAELEAALAAGREGTCETCAHAHEYEGALSCGLTESGRAIAHMMDCSYWEPKEDA